MTANNAILEMGDGNECLYVPGPGGYNIVFEGRGTVSHSEEPLLEPDCAVHCL